VRLLYVGTLPPHQGGSALVAAQVLRGLARRFEIDAVAPITEATDDEFAALNPDIAVRRFTLPYLDTSPDSPPAEDYRARERECIERLIASAPRPDVILIGRESFASHVVDLADGVPTALLIQGATTMGILNGSYPADLAERLLDRLRAVDAPVTSARHMQRTLAELGVPGVRVIPNPVDLERFRPAPRPSASELVVAHLSNLKALKRVLDLVEAAAIALREERDLRFVVVGDGPGRAEIEAACAERGVEQAFRFTGWVGHDEVPRLINSADIVVMPSAGEAQALVYLEAQACARTLIASDIPAAAEVVDHGNNGLLFPVGDVEALAAAIVTAARDPELRARLGREARRRVERHSLEDVVEAYAGLLEELTTRSAAE